MLRIIVTPTAEWEVTEAFEHLIEEAGLDVADRFLAAFDETARFLAAMPGVGRVREAKDPSAKGLRSWAVDGFPNYLVFYVPGAESLVVMRLLHGARDLRFILDEDEDMVYRAPSELTDESFGYDDSDEGPKGG